ncbi:hypothetical protein [Enterococcus mundtii]|uniref:hypothetical protein n=1 Tax=Enterococcus mundtii TaxID=53346 RepID=UPI0039705D17
MDKLIRTKLRDKILKTNPDAQFIELTSGAVENELEKKLLEEIQEFIEAKSANEKTEEMADILEVIDAFYSFDLLKKEQVLHAKTKKYVERGGFKEGIYWKK